jgi:hypothetical protein
MAFTLEQIPSVVMTLVLAAAIFVAGFLVTDGLDDDLAANSYAANATDAIDEGMYNVTEYIPTLGTIIGVALILGVVIAGFYFGRTRGWM